jgi:hypothetical protein
MKKTIFNLLAVLLIASTSYAIPVYVEGINDDQTVDTGFSTDALKETTFLYTPNSSYSLTQVDFYTYSGQGGFTLRLRADNDGTPGSILRETTFQLAGSGFQGSEFLTPIDISLGSSYWVGFYTEFGTGSHFAQDGVSVTEYASWSTNGTWDVGPSSWLKPMIKFYGEESAPVPEPATFILLGSGLAGLAFYRRKKK